VLAVERGAHIVRTHDVGATLDALKVAAAVMRPGENL
jgi:dihydropteroate synthase